ncbi:MAG: hypothetical protein NTY73_04130 [Candidatus Micrarchaeota archaeon]|nr:hypothetical protein [Candidatus Micrarchaeota archaeon]
MAEKVIDKDKKNITDEIRKHGPESKERMAGTIAGIKMRKLDVNCWYGIGGLERGSDQIIVSAGAKRRLDPEEQGLGDIVVRYEKSLYDPEKYERVTIGFNEQGKFTGKIRVKDTTLDITATGADVKEFLEEKARRGLSEAQERKLFKNIDMVEKIRKKQVGTLKKIANDTSKL